MENEQRLVSLYKQHHYDRLKGHFRKKLVYVLAAGSLLGVTAAAYTSHLIVTISCTVALTVALTSLLLYQLKKMNAQTACLIPLVYICFVQIPLSWLFGDGLSGNCPYFALALIAVIVAAQIKRHQTRLLILFDVLLAALALYTFIEEKTTNIIGLFAYLASIVIITVFLVLMVARFNMLNDHVLRSAIKDELTGMYNRRVLDDIMTIKEEGYAKERKDYMLIMLDVDKFKQLNDKLGHTGGDRILQSLAICIRRYIRSTDYCVRFGGDEFLIVLEDTSAEQAQRIFDRVAQAMCSELITDIPVTMSRGHALRSECGYASELINLADRRMYANKRRQSCE